MWLKKQKRYPRHFLLCGAEIVCSPSPTPPPPPAHPSISPGARLAPDHRPPRCESETIPNYSRLGATPGREWLVEVGHHTPVVLESCPARSHSRLGLARESWSPHPEGPGINSRPGVTPGREWLSHFFLGKFNAPPVLQTK